MQSVLLDLRLLCKEEVQGNPYFWFKADSKHRMKMIGNLIQLCKAHFREKSLHLMNIRLLHVFCFTRYMKMLKLLLIRTANRHRYSSRVD